MYPGASCLECVTCLTSGITFIIIWWCIWCSKWQTWFVPHQWQCGEVDTCSLWLSILCHQSRFWLVYMNKCFVSDSFVSRCVIWDTTAIGGNVQNPWPAHICRKVFCQWHVDLSLVAECVVSVTDLISLWKMCVSGCVVCLDFVRNRSALLWSYAPNLIIKLWKAAVKIKHLHHSDFQLFFRANWTQIIGTLCWTHGICTVYKCADSFYNQCNNVFTGWDLSEKSCFNVAK